VERPSYPDQLEGRNLVLAALQHSGRVREFWIDEGARSCPKLERIRALGKERGSRCKTVPRAHLEAVSRTAVHNGVIAFAEPLPAHSLHEILEAVDARGGTPFVLILDQVQYEQNLGAVLRSAACSGVDVVVVPTRRGAPLSANAQRVAMGAAEQVPVVREGMMSALAALRRRGIPIVAAEASAEQAYFEIDLTGPLALVLGGEDHGVGAGIRERCDHLVSIPIRSELVTSLNVSVAAGILLFERVRQQQIG
jgi:23S rRNA (guanosine2251-2'-O)-methyltransferase